MGCVDFRTDFVRGTELGYILVVELQRTVQVAVQAEGERKAFGLTRTSKTLCMRRMTSGVFRWLSGVCCLWRLGSLQHHAAYGIFPFDQELEHEA